MCESTKTFIRLRPKKMALRTILLAALLAASGSSLPTNELSGTPTLKPIPITDAPFMVQFSDNCITQWEGVILNENYVLSTSLDFATSMDYCDSGDFNQITVRVGSNANSGGKVIKIAEVYEASEIAVVTDMTQLVNIALFRLESPLTFDDTIQPVKLAKKSWFAPKKVKVVSFNLKLTSDYTIPYLLRSVELGVYSKSECEKYFKSRHNVEIGSYNFCVEKPYGPVSFFSSGAPALNQKGELLGFQSQQDDGINFFNDITSDTVSNFIDDVFAGKYEKVTIVNAPTAAAPSS